jgi:hypothetical protein
VRAAWVAATCIPTNLDLKPTNSQTCNVARFRSERGFYSDVLGPASQDDLESFVQGPEIGLASRQRARTGAGGIAVSTHRPASGRFLNILPSAFRVGLSFL